MSPSPRPPCYRAYLLRCWREATGWRFSLEDPRTGDRQGFAGPDALLAHLESTLTGRRAPEPGGRDGDGGRRSGGGEDEAGQR
jgi:hypothetical protein